LRKTYIGTYSFLYLSFAAQFGFIPSAIAATNTGRYTPIIRRLPAETASAPENATISNLPFDLEQIATITGALPILQRLYAVQAELRNARTSEITLEYLAKRQTLIYLHQKLIHVLDTANLEVNASRGQIEAEMASMQQLRARMMDDNARVLRRNTIINFISGGITKIAGYSIALGTTDVPTNILEVFDGGVQCTLSGMVIKQLHSESESVKDVPDVLAVLDQPGVGQRVYPPQVWAYLSASPGNGSVHVSRRVMLTSGWEGRGIISRRDKAFRQVKSGHFHNDMTLARMAPQLLDDRDAMLAELRSTVSQMHKGLMQLSQISKKSYDDDPPFDQ
jgi:hypothetical protein